MTRRAKIAAGAAGAALLGVPLGLSQGGGTIDVFVGSTPTATATAAFPDATNTGVPSGTSLTTVSGIQTISTANSTYQDKLVNGCVIVNADNVTIKNVKVVISNGCDTGIIDNQAAAPPHGLNLVVQDSEVDCGLVVGHTAISSEQYTATRMNLHGCDNAAWAETNVTIQDSYIHDEVPYDPALDPHTDAVQIPAGASNIDLTHNTIYGGFQNPDTAHGGPNDTGFGNSAITMGGSPNPNVTSIVVADNKLSGGGYTLQCGTGTISVTGNRWTNAPEAAAGWSGFYGGFGPTLNCDTASPYTDNTYLDGTLSGQSVPST